MAGERDRHKSDVDLDLIKFMVDQIRAATAPVLTEIKGIRADISNINERLAAGDERLDRHSEMLQSAQPVLERCRNSKHAEEGTTQIIRRKAGLPWWAILLIGGALTWIGERGIQSVINALADKPVAMQSAGKP